MKFILGDMWNKASSCNPLLKVLRALLIMPALAGAFACYLVFWMLFRIWPFLAVFVAIQVLLGLLLFIHATSFARQISRQTIDLEDAVRILGVMLAIAVGFLWALPRMHG